MKLQTLRFSASWRSPPRSRSPPAAAAGAPATCCRRRNRPPPARGPDSFLLFPNPQVQADGSLQTNTPRLRPGLLRRHRSEQRQGHARQVEGGQRLRHRHRHAGHRRLRRPARPGLRAAHDARQNPDGTLAFFVENYLVKAAPGTPIRRSTSTPRSCATRDGCVAINAIEFSPGPGGGASFAEVLQLQRRHGRARDRWTSTAAGRRRCPARASPATAGAATR